VQKDHRRSIGGAELGIPDREDPRVDLLDGPEWSRRLRLSRRRGARRDACLRVRGHADAKLGRTDCECGAAKEAAAVTEGSRIHAFVSSKRSALRRGRPTPKYCLRPPWK